MWFNTLYTEIPILSIGQSRFYYKSAIEKAGYGATQKESHKTDASKQNQDEDMLADKETPKLLRRLIASLVFLSVLMYVSMGHMMWGWYLPDFISHNHVALGILQLLLCTAVMVINQKFFINGFKGLIHKSPNMDTLVALGSAASYIYSLYVPQYDIVLRTPP